MESHEIDTFHDLLFFKLNSRHVPDQVIDYISSIYGKLYKDYDAEDPSDIEILNNKVELIASSFEAIASGAADGLTRNQREFLRLTLSTKH